MGKSLWFQSHRRNSAESLSGSERGKALAPIAFDNAGNGLGKTAMLNVLRANDKQAKQESAGIDQKQSPFGGVNANATRLQKVPVQAGRPNLERNPGTLQPWRKIPQWVNRFWFLVKSQSKRQNDYLDYDPFNLRIFTNQRYNAFGDQFYINTLKNDKQLLQRLSQKEMDLETFKLVLEQVPGVRTIEFSGRGEPLLNPDLFNMIQYAHTYNKAETLVVTNGLLLGKHIGALVNSPLTQICINLYGHKPSTYHQMSGLDAHNFVPIIENIKRLVARRNDSHSGLKITLSMTTDVHTFHSMPEMIVMAHELGVDGITINNFLSDNPEEASERTLYRDQEIVVEFMKAISEKVSQFENFEVSLPVLMDRNMKHNHFCQEPYTTVAVDGNCTVYPCSRQLLEDELGETPKVWEQDFWNHSSYHHLRDIHSRSKSGYSGIESPKACQNCPKNLSQ